MSKPYLVTLLPSADCDMGRWLLQYWGIDYDERAHAPVFHVLALKWHGVGAYDYPLFVRDGVNWPKVDKMVEKFDPLAPPERRLLPDAETEPDLRAEVLALDDELRHGLGNGVVHWCYFHFLQHRDVVWPSLVTGVPWYERAFLTINYGLIASLMTKGLGLGPEDSVKALGKINAGFDRVDTLLADGRRYLCGDRLTLADIAVATAGAPVVLARGYAGHLPTLDQCPPEMREIMEPLIARPTGQFIQRIYDEHRLPT